MSSPSDGISLDSQHDSMKSKDKWTTDQEDCSDQDLAGTPELGPPKSPSWERSSSGGWPPRSETAASGEHEDLRLSRWPQDTLAEPEEELGEMEDRSALSNSAHGCPRDAAILDGDEEPIPVTFIGEVLDDPVDAGLFSNRNNNASSSDTGSTHDTKAPLPPCRAAPGQQPGTGRAATPNPPSPEDAGKETKPAASSTWKDVNPNKTEPQTTSAPALHTRALDAREGKARDDQTPGPALVNGSRWVPVPSEPPHSPREIGTNGHAGREPLGREEKPRLLSTDALETDGTQPASIFGPKKRFRPVVQRPAPKDMSLHSALMEAIHSAGGKDGLRKIAEHSPERGPKTPSHAEADSERSALLAAIRGHRGACSLRKVSSSASEELQSFRDAVLSAHGSGPPGPEDVGAQFPAAPPPPPPPPATQTPITSRTASRASSGPLSSPGDARQALLDAIRSGTGAARLRKVPLLV
ncbi:Protein cordon-bleu [Camelus dromedarius]|uniref:Protein cordon-bleu n=1 Tax=Camelus dromedarius TaxID=9838 RepID=A0A5N4C4H0_CAMDR|nr:Protein cordon-bleu [Camelus dromedarius]